MNSICIIFGINFFNIAIMNLTIDSNNI